MKRKIKITRRFVYSVTSLTIFLFILFFAIITFAIKNASKSSVIVDNSGVIDESIIIENDINNSIDLEISDVSEDCSLEISDIDDESYYNDIDVSEVEDIEHGWVINEYGFTYVYNGCGYEQFNYKSSALNRYVNALNNFVALVPAETRVFSITVPVSSTFAQIPREIYTADNFYNQAQSAFVSTVAINTNERITHIQIVDLLENLYDEGEYVYYRTDNNWTANAAFFAYEKFCEAAEMESKDLKFFQKNSVPNFLGSFYNATKSEAMKNSPDEFIYYLPDNSVKTSLTVYDNGLIYTNYSIGGNNIDPSFAQNSYLGRDAERYEIHTTFEGGSLLIVGDESVYPMVSFLTSHYKNIDIINPLKFKTDLCQFLEERKYDDCLVMCYSTNSINGDYIPIFNSLTGAITNE